MSDYVMSGHFVISESDAENDDPTECEADIHPYYKRHKRKKKCDSSRRAETSSSDSEEEYSRTDMKMMRPNDRWLVRSKDSLYKSGMDRSVISERGIRTNGAAYKPNYTMHRKDRLQREVGKSAKFKKIKDALPHMRKLVPVLNSSRASSDDEMFSPYRPPPESVVLPPSPESDVSDDVMQDQVLDVLLSQKTTVHESTPERLLDRMSPSNLDSPPDSDMSEGERTPDRRTQETAFTFQSDGSDFESVLSRCTGDVLEKSNQSPDYSLPDSDENELPAIGYHTQGPSPGGLSGDFDIPPVLREHIDADVPEAFHEHDDRVHLDVRAPPSMGTCSGPSTSSRDVLFDEPPHKKPHLSGDKVPPCHLKMASSRTRRGNPGNGAVCFTSHMRNFVESCNDEGFISAAITIMLQLTTTNTYPPPDMIKALLESVLLDHSLPLHLTTEAYHALQMVNRLHPLTSARVGLDWECISDVISVLIIEARSLSIITETHPTAHTIGSSARSRSLQALQFVKLVLENDIQRVIEEGDSRPFIFERYIVKDIIDRLDDCLSCYRPDLTRESRQFLNELMGHLQELLNLACHRDLGDQVDFISHNLVHKLDNWSLQQKCFFFQTIRAPVLSQSLIEVYLQSRYELPACAVCRDQTLRLLSCRRLCLAKIFQYHIHQRPLEATQATSKENLYYEDEETGERVHPGVTGSEVNDAEGQHCPSCSKRVALSAGQAEVLVMLLMNLLRSFLLSPSGLQFSEEDKEVLTNLDRYIHSLRTDLLLSCPKLSMRTKLYLQQMALLGEKCFQT